MNLFLFYLPFLTFVLCEDDNWSPEEGNSTFEPSSTVLEQWSGLNDRTDKVMKKPDRYIMNRPPKEPTQQGNHDKGVTETDLFLLGAIEKLAYRVEFLEKRLTRAEEMLYRFISGTQFNEKQDPCPEHFKRIGNICYHVSSKQVNWKSASSMCRSLSSALLEFEAGEEEKAVLSSLQLDPLYQGNFTQNPFENPTYYTYGHIFNGELFLNILCRNQTVLHLGLSIDNVENAIISQVRRSPAHSVLGKDFWTGGLNPGLLWIWSNSAKPILTNSSQGAEKKPIDGNGRCLLLKYQALTKTYVYKGIDCSSRNYFICRFSENAVERKLERLQRDFKFKNDTGELHLFSNGN